MASRIGRKRPARYTLDVHFASEEEKEAFIARLKAVQELLTPAGSRLIDNCSLLNTFDAVEAGVQPSTESDLGSGPSTKSFLRNSSESFVASL